ncbi:MAG: sigma 54-interacting transcriptional regulator [Deltaproteobacteria bacterium]|nr:sigma 54-interacting transcriptional regulator [Deltaproteobacteria bacterium]
MEKWNFNDVFERLLNAPPAERRRRIERWAESISGLGTVNHREWENLLQGVIKAADVYPALDSSTRDLVLSDLLSQLPTPLCICCKDKFIPLLRSVFVTRGMPVRAAVWDKFKGDLGPYELLSDFWTNGKLFDEVEEIYSICSFLEGELKKKDSFENVLEEIEKLKHRIPDGAKKQLERIEKQLCIYSLKDQIRGKQLRFKVYGALKHVIRDKTNILVLGASGIGKNDIVQFIHNARGCPGEPKKMNCADLTVGMLKGTRASAGILEQAKGRVLCLDEVHELRRSVQEMLKTILAEGELIRKDGTSVRLDFKLVSTSSRTDLSTDWRSVFKEIDIWTRIGEYTFVIPDLSKRREDLADGYRRIAAPVEIAADVLQTWTRRDYEGNWREIIPAVNEVTQRIRELGVRLIITRQTLEQLPPRMDPE